MPILGDARHPTPLKNAQQKVLDGMTFLRNRLRSLYGGKQLCTANASTNTFTLAQHELRDDDRVAFRGSLPGGVVVSTVYYVVNSDRAGGTFQISPSQGGAPLDLLSAGGTFYVVRDGASQIGLVGALASGGDTISTVHEAFALVGLLAATQTWSGVNTFASLSAVTALVSGLLTLARTGDTNFLLESTGSPSTRKAIAKLLTSGGRYVRVYMPASLPGIEIVVNAQWNGSNWHKDDGAETFRLTLNTDGVRLDHLQTDDTDTWDNALWLISIGNLKANAIFPKNIVKAWGTVTTDGAGGATLTDSHGCTVGSPSSTNVPITLTEAMANSNYAVVATLNDNVARYAKAIVSSSTVFNLQSVQGSTDTADNLTSTTRRIAFVVLGAQ